MRLTLCPINPVVGDVAGNAALIRGELDRVASVSDLIVFPELAICGYPPRDLLLAEGFVDSCRRACDEIASGIDSRLTVLVGSPVVDDGCPGIGNALLVLRAGKVQLIYRKRLLPTYDVFDEDRYFTPGTRAGTIDVGGVKVGLSICEDLWRGQDAGVDARYAREPDPIDELAGAQLVVSASASPFVLGKRDRHLSILRTAAQRLKVPVASVNQLGGNDELVFDGHTFVVSPDGVTIGGGPLFARAGSLTLDPFASSGPTADSTPPMRDLFEALVLGVRDYARKTGFKSALLGLSGGIDSALVVTLAAAALGASNVTGVAMPGPFSSDHSLDDAREVAGRLGVRLLSVPMLEAMRGMVATVDPALSAMAQPALGARQPDIANENLQSRLRGVILMALSNRTGAIVLTTGNKSELAVGYCTLYGDMNGGLAVISDLTKQQVYQLARWINANPELCGFDTAPIPERSIEKAPSAELRPDQTDQDSLPPYDHLDAIIECLVERRMSVESCVRTTGLDRALITSIAKMIDVAEYKRRQAAPGIKISGVAFGSGRRMPIAQRRSSR